MEILELAKPSLASLLALIEGQPGQYRYLFRGQADADWGLVPALYRKELSIYSAIREKSFDFFEFSSISRFFDEALPYLPAIQRSYSNDRILAQHFGVPTRSRGQRLTWV